ncbi:MAG: type I DNA topoisomerase [Candidatus Magasanikbacteria bacterium CG10_big_fil_rev_8_21_14_0_10_40_10]|uniref:DNA topoisomerase 1 n=1 Tax=Candidatus Magasanikbacteria bacterium CG10_big_fil_rev_8_21_14_0_10_40_10 TaxID=1974648 RepID=A0A2M6W4B8_9BACT|nr:MAG: type I DNA topoisomerase [Candidatus Magasanikbacteria bacterium CG10_big_fil_rev_8_21_14_0_10_40_10]
MKTLVIVESPTKAKTISKFLGKDFIVKSSFGHIRDLPKSKLGVDVANNFEPQYINSRDKLKTIKELKDSAKKTGNILFATDEDREGEAISWHLAHILGVKPNKAQRIVFHEITQHAIEEALKNPRPLDLKLFDAQQARRVLDRLVGYKLSPFLWKKVARGLSAGRVQSVAVRLVVEREREIQKFVPQEYWTVSGQFYDARSNSNDTDNLIEAKLFSIQDKKLAKMDLKDKKQIDEILKDLDQAKYNIGNVDQKKKTRSPLPPFITSTLQQEANNRLGFSAKQTMRLAQQLYEGIDVIGHGSVGLITYMRTDSLNLSVKFLTEAQDYINKEFGQKYSIDKPRVFKKKSKNAQEAHEAIRPSQVEFTPDSIKSSLDSRQFKLYDLIWRRAVSSQMASAQINAVNIDIASHNQYIFRASGQTIAFDGFLKLYPEKSKENILPNVKEGQEMKSLELKPEQHYTEPPARYSDATLVKTMEENGIGRPSTYAPTIHTIEARNYVERDENKRLKPTDIAFIVNDLLVEHFDKVVDYQFTADMEGYLDDIAEGKRQWQNVIKEFYDPFARNLTVKDKELNKKELTEEKTNEICEKCSSPMIIKMGRFGKFLACSNYPECKNTKNIISNEKGQEVIEEPILSDEKCAKCGSPMAQKTGRFGAFLGCSNYPKCKNIVNIEKSTNVKCPQCQKGDIVEKRSRRGKIFYACNQYPDCKFALWSKPTGAKCPQCSSLLVYGPKDTLKCSHKECQYTQEA